MLALAGLTGAALVPSTAQAVPTAAPALVRAADTEVDDLRLDRAQAHALRERADRVARALPAAQSSLGGVGLESSTTNPYVRRVAGENRYGTAAALARTYWAEEFWNEAKYGPVPGPKVVFVASGADFADALSGGAAAAAFGGPLLLTKKDSLPPETEDVLGSLAPDVIVVLGGTAAVSDKVAGALGSYVTVPGNVHRISGKNRYDVSAALARTIGWSPVAYVASGENFPDGLTGGAAAGAEVAPLLITRPGSVPDSVMKVLQEDVIPSQIYVLGGPVAVSDDVVTQLSTIAKVKRIGGSNRYVVAERVAALHPSTGGATAASGENWPDALAGTPFAGLVGDKLLLLRSTGVPLPTERAVLEHLLVNIDVLGGKAALPDAVLTELRRLEVPVAE